MFHFFSVLSINTFLSVGTWHYANPSTQRIICLGYLSEGSELEYVVQPASRSDTYTQTTAFAVRASVPSTVGGSVSSRVESGSRGLACSARLVVV